MPVLGDYVGLDDVVVGGYLFWYAPANTAYPALTLDMYDALPSPWVCAGSTKEGWKFDAGADITELTVEEQDAPVRRTKKRTFTLSATLAETNLENMKLAIGGGTVTAIAAVTGGTPAPAHKRFTFSDDYDEIACILSGPGPKNNVGKPTVERLYLPRCDSAGTLSVAYRRLSDYQQFGVSIAALTTSGAFVDQIDLHPV